MATSILVTTEQPQQLVDITDRVASVAASAGVDEGAVLVYCPHTTCGLAVNEAEDGLHEDLAAVLEELAPRHRAWAHDDLSRRAQTLTPGETERPNGWSHIRALLATAPSLTLPVAAGRLALGRWQRVFLVELDGARQRTLSVHAWAAFPTGSVIE